MSSSDRSQAVPDGSVSDELASYQAISVLAIAALIVGAASAVALIAIPLWIVPLVGIVLSGLALGHVERSAGALAGRSLALAGLGLSVCFGVAGIAAYWNSQRLVADQAQQAAEKWFQALAEDEPQRAHQMTLHMRDRAGVSSHDQLAAFYQNDQKQSERLAKFVGNDPAKILLALGKRAHVQLESTASVDETLSVVIQVYKVTYQNVGKPEQFSVRLVLTSVIPPFETKVHWRVSESVGVGPQPPPLVD
jgi:hypothetical protein